MKIKKSYNKALKASTKNILGMNKTLLYNDLTMNQVCISEIVGTSNNKEKKNKIGRK